MICRVCLASVKKNAVICDHCSLIAHAKCAPDAAPTCDLRSQLLLFAEKGSTNVFQQFRDGATPSSLPNQMWGPMPSEASTPTPPPLSAPSSGHGTPPKPSAAFKIMSGFGRSRSSLCISQSASPLPIPVAEDKIAERKSSKLRHDVQANERPLSDSSNSTDPKSFKTIDSQSSRQEPRRSFFSIIEPDADMLPRTGQGLPESVSSSRIVSNGGALSERAQQEVPVSSSGEPDRQKKRHSDKHTICVVQ